MRPADVNEENKDEVWTRVCGYPLSTFPKPEFKMETEMGYLFSDRPEGEAGEEGEAETSFIEDNDLPVTSFDELLNNANQNLDEAMIASFREENEDDRYKKRREQTDKLYLVGTFDEIK
ncbi:Hypothetical predicted protein [Paramuricea clavata]|uniref:Uncharacterized protein n=1 Tax=Paramuricea clavata TaxID=317549 RepID=A0A7D9L9W0_PARCT|nr:Hypothetical predicted protein [Paramuricea clavata]